MTQYVLSIRYVADYARWPAVFLHAIPLLKGAGELRNFLLAAEAISNQFGRFSEWSSLAAVCAFFETDRLVQIRRGAGAKAPEFHYLNIIKKKEF